MGKQHFRDVERYSLDRKVVYFDIPCKLSPWEHQGVVMMTCVMYSFFDIYVVEGKILYC